MRLTSKPPRIFYGWWVVGACLLIALYNGGVIFFGFTAFFEPIVEDFGWSYAQTSIAASLRGIEIGLLAPVFGLLVDRWGSRRLVFGGSIIAGLGLILLGRIHSLGTFYGAFILMAVGLSALSQTVLLTTVVSWFRKNMGIATGLVVSGFALGSLMVPVSTLLIEQFDWRTAAITLGIGAWIIGLPLSLLLKPRPKQYHIPGDDIESTMITDNDLDSGQSPDDFSLKRALKSHAFWGIALVFAYHQFVTSGVVTHIMPYLSNVGIDRSTASLVALAAPLVSVGGRLGIGWLGDRINKKKLTGLCIVMLSVGLFFFGQVPTLGMWSLVPYVLLFGIGWGGNVILRVALVREYFGTKRFGTMHGFTIGVMMAGSIAGAPIAGWIFDKWGSYQGAWFAFAGLSIIALAILATIPPVDRVKK